MTPRLSAVRVLPTEALPLSSRGSAAEFGGRCGVRLQVAAVTSAAEAQLREAMTGAGMSLLDSAPPDLWPRLHRLHAAASATTTESAFSQLKARAAAASCACSRA